MFFCTFQFGIYYFAVLIPGSYTAIMTLWCPQLLLSTYSAPSDGSAVSEQQRQHLALMMKQLLGNSWWSLSHLMLEKKQILQCGLPCAATHHAGGCGNAVAWGACAARLKACSVQRNRDRSQACLFWEMSPGFVLQREEMKGAQEERAVWQARVLFLS